MKYPVYLYIAVMAIVTYLIRMLPLTLIKKPSRPLSTQLLLLFPELPLWQWHCFSLIKERACSRFPLQPVPSCLSWSFSYNIIALTWKICHWQVLTSE